MSMVTWQTTKEARKVLLKQREKQTNLLNLEPFKANLKTRWGRLKYLKPKNLWLLKGPSINAAKTSVVVVVYLESVAV